MTTSTTTTKILKGLPKVKAKDLKGKPISGFWAIRNDQLMIMPFGGSWHRPNNPQVGPGGVLLVNGMVLVQTQQH